jgi:hypothetical protein
MERLAVECGCGSLKAIVTIDPRDLEAAKKMDAELANVQKGAKVEEPIASDDQSARRAGDGWLSHRPHRGGHVAPRVSVIGRRTELAIATTLLLCLSAILALAEMPVGATRSSSEAPGKPNADEGAIHERAIADCERIWDRGTHMTKQEWSRTCRRVQARLQRLDVEKVR